jgi:hypothetical protein
MIKLIDIVDEMLSEGLNLPKKAKVTYSYQHRCYKDGDPHGYNEIYDDEECLWAKSLQDTLETIIEKIPDRFNIRDIKLFDKYQGPYAEVQIDKLRFKVWTVDEAMGHLLWIDDYPIDNTSSDGENPGFKGTWSEIVDVIEHPEKYSNS